MRVHVKVEKVLYKNTITLDFYNSKTDRESVIEFLAAICRDISFCDVPVRVSIITTSTVEFHQVYGDQQTVINCLAGVAKTLLPHYTHSRCVALAHGVYMSEEETT